MRLHDSPSPRQRRDLPQPLLRELRGRAPRRGNRGLEPRRPPRPGPGSVLMVQDPLASRFGGAITTGENPPLSALSSRNGYHPGPGQLQSGIATAIGFTDRDPKRDESYFATPDPELKAGFRALTQGESEENYVAKGPDGGVPEGSAHVGDVGTDGNRLEERIITGPGPAYDTRSAVGTEGQP